MWQTTTPLACFLALLITTVVEATGNATFHHYVLPSFSLVLNVDKTENELIVFQDKLDGAVAEHLHTFFRKKIKESSFPNVFLRDIPLTGDYIWKQLSEDVITLDSDQSSLHRYEVHASFDAELDVNFNTLQTSSKETTTTSPISESIMKLFLIEAFQGDNYWNLVHTFFQDEVLESITGMKVTVMADGYVPYNGDIQDAMSADQAKWSGVWTTAMIVGMCFATVCFGMMIVIWTYLCCCARSSIWVRLDARRRRRRQKDLPGGEKQDSTTEDSQSSSSLQNEEGMEGDKKDRTDQVWLDEWAKSITSIPIRDPTKPRKVKKKAASIRRPGRHHNSNLNAIVETPSTDDDNSTICSIESRNSSHHSRKSSHTTTTTKQKKNAIMEAEDDPEEEEQDGESPTTSDLEEGQCSIQECDEESDADDDDDDDDNDNDDDGDDDDDDDDDDVSISSCTTQFSQPPEEEEEKEEKSNKKNRCIV